jgi:putative PEP-CTERM system histidine kinase
MLYAVCYGTGFVAFIFVIALMLLRQMPKGVGLGILAVYALTAGWALTAGLQPWWNPGVAHLFDSIRNSAWLVLIAHIFVLASRTDTNRSSAFYRFVVPLICIAAVGNDLRFVTTTVLPTQFAPSQIFSRIIVAICGLLLVENLLRNTLPARRWHIVPLCLAVGSLFAYDLLVFSGAVIVRSVDPFLLIGRGFVLVLMVPALVVTMVRNQSWNVDVHVSRRVVFHTATLSIAGVFLIAAAGIAGFVGRVSGDLGGLFRLVFFVASIVALATMFSIASLRSRLWRVLTENFFSSRFDYRAEWNRCIATLSSSADRDPLQCRVIRALADIVDSPGGVLWLRQPDGKYRVANSLNMSIGDPSPEASEGSFVSAFRGGTIVQVFERGRPQGAQPTWLRQHTPVWLGIPLMMFDKMLGFVVLAPPRAPQAPDWESFDLLLTIGRQGASWIAEEIAARALSDSQILFEYSKRFSFVAHDVKNVSSQLAMMIANMRQFGDQPDFRADMVRTMEASIDRLNRLIGRLGNSDEPYKPVRDVAGVIADVLSAFPPSVEFQCSANATACDSISEVDLRSVLTHIISNSLEASPPAECVHVTLTAGDGLATIAVEDQGCGMDPAFVRDQLFSPLRTTKKTGHGIGAYQARELVLSAGGSLDVVSALRKGTRVRIVLPLTSQRSCPVVVSA